MHENQSAIQHVHTTRSVALSFIGLVMVISVSSVDYEWRVMMMRIE